MKQADQREMPVASLGISVGTLAMTKAWWVGVTVWHLDVAIAKALTAGALMLWGVLLGAYVLKWINHTALARKELNDPQRSLFFAFVPVSSLLAASLLIPFAPLVAAGIFVAAVVTHLSWGVVAHGRFLKGTDHPSIKTPAVYLSSVAPNLVSAATASALGWPRLGALFFGAGVVYWLLIEALILSSAANNREMDKALRPTMGIQLAPPFVAGVAWFALHGGPSDMLARFLLGYGLYQVLLLLRLIPWILEQPFAPSYWAFSFGVAALPTMAMLMVERGESGLVAWLAPGLFVAANLIIALLIVKTLALTVRGRLMPGERSLSRETTR